MPTISRLLVIFLLNSLWQTALIVASAWVASCLLRNVPARYRHRVWVAALVLCWLLPLWSIFTLSPAVSSGVSTRLIYAGPANPNAASVSILHWSGVVPFGPLWTNVIAAAFTFLLLLRMARFLHIWFRTIDLRRSSSSFETPEALSAIARRCQSVLGISPVSLLSSPLARSPLTFGLLRHTIVLPESLLQSATEEDWLSALSHEMAHIRRRDFSKNLIYQLLYCALWFNPTAVFLLRQIERTRELACDELATERLISPAGYARSLVNMARLISAPSAKTDPDYSLGVFDANILEERIMKLLAPNHLSAFKTKMLLAVACLIPAAPVVSATAFALTVKSPSQEQSPASTPSKPGQSESKTDPDVVKPKPIYTPDPEFPRSAHKKKNFHGSMTLAIVVGKDGKVISTKVVDSLGKDFDANAIKTVRKWKFEPAAKNGQPVEAELKVEVNFSTY